MNGIVHARLAPAEKRLLDALGSATGEGASELVRKGLRLLYRRLFRKGTALALCGESVGRFTAPVRDLSCNKNHMKGYGR